MYDLCDLRKIVLDLRRFEETLKSKTTLTLNEALCLCQICKGTEEPGKLAKEMELSPSRLSRLLDALEKKDLIIRTTSDVDRRVISISIQKKGKIFLQTMRETSIELPSYLQLAIQTFHTKEQ